MYEFGIVFVLHKFTGPHIHTLMNRFNLDNTDNLKSLKQ